MIKDNYLPEDIHKVSDEILKLQKTCIDVLRMCTAGELENAEKMQQEIYLSLKIIKAYNKKKTHRESHNPILWEGDRLIWTR